jgi:hypothetical protein
VLIEHQVVQYGGVGRFIADRSPNSVVRVCTTALQRQTIWCNVNTEDQYDSDLQPQHQRRGIVRDAAL